jgi:hypothetical protein
MTEAEFKRDIVRQLTREGGYARRLEDRYAVGTLDLLLLTPKYLIYAEAKLLKGIALPARVAQREQIQIFNNVRNEHAYALVVGLKDKSVGFGLPGERWDEHYTMLWPIVGPYSLTQHLDMAVAEIFEKQEAA